MSFFDGAKICVIECTSFMLSLIALLGGGHGIFMTKPAFSISSRRRVWTN